MWAWKKLITVVLYIIKTFIEKLLILWYLDWIIHVCTYVYYNFTNKTIFIITNHSRRLYNPILPDFSGCRFITNVVCKWQKNYIIYEKCAFLMLENPESLDFKQKRSSKKK
jgi:hypothetical protein